jgi:hypothetical protein
MRDDATGAWRGVAWRRVPTLFCWRVDDCRSVTLHRFGRVGAWGVKPRAAHAPYVPASLLPAAAGCRLDAFVAVVRGGEAPGPGRAPEPETMQTGLPPSPTSKRNIPS